jgi:hypothetical protein
LDGYLNQNNQSFIGFIQNGKIFNSYGQQLGVVNDEFNKAVDTAKGFQQKLIDAGILTKPKTAEEINLELQETLKETQKMMLDMSNTIVTLNEKVNKLEGVGDVQQGNNGAGRSENARTKGSGNVQPAIRPCQQDSNNVPKP